jgi:hypothetical protein
MKSHDFHVMMQDILPLCMQHLMANGCRMAIIARIMCSKNFVPKLWTKTFMDDFKHDVIVTLVLLEKEFPCFFFDTMMHILVHLVEELKFCGPMHTC